MVGWVGSASGTIRAYWPYWSSWDVGLTNEAISWFGQRLGHLWTVSTTWFNSCWWWWGRNTNGVFLGIGAKFVLDIVFGRALVILSMVWSHFREDAVHNNHPLGFQHMPCGNGLHTQENLFDITNWLQNALHHEGITTLIKGQYWCVHTTVHLWKS